MRLLWNIILAIFWSSLWGPLALPQLILGFLIGYVVIALLEKSNVIKNKRYGTRVRRIVFFIGFFLKELWLSNVKVAMDVIRPNPRYKPAIIAVPLDLKQDSAITLLANLITLTPGTLSIDVSEDKKKLFVHTMFLEGSKADFIREIKEGFEARVKELFQ